MPTEIRRRSVPTIGRSRTLRLSPATIALTVAFVAFHLISGVLLERSHASPAMAPATSVDDLTCPMAAAPPPEQTLPFD
jgi:hypothetical protein